MIAKNGTIEQHLKELPKASYSPNDGCEMYMHCGERPSPPLSLSPKPNPNWDTAFIPDVINHLYL